MSGKRTSNFECLRIFAIILILVMHSYAQADCKENSFNIFLGYVISAIGNTGVSCFVLLSGYFGLKFKIQRFIQLILITTFYTVISFIANNGLVFNISFFDSLIVVLRYKNWFIACYLILMLLSPFINKAMQAISKMEYNKLLSILFVTFSVLPTLFRSYYYTILTDGGKCLVYILFLYIIGRYLSLFYSDKKVSKSICLLSFLSLIILIVALNVTISFIFHRECRIFSMDCSPLILFSSLCVFFFFKGLTMKSKLVNNIAASVLAVYLLDNLRLYVSDHILNITFYAESDSFILYLIVFVLVVFVLGIVIDKIRIFVCGKCESYIIEKIIYMLNLAKMNL
ncbi:acyltransferase family protein [Bacteroides xylanisolvens]|uniref:acyltransferase family protein n=1 Tax=Bacteroides xylanisolvens TaxID=371601 RepID=UPI00374E8BD9